MPLIGFFLIVTGLIMNVQVLRRPRGEGVVAAQVMGSAPWLISVAIIAVGILVLTIAR
ncbi:MAG TPA: hypothetical protein VIO57_10530 [Chloroflexota bacterium]|jgi:hypothetical protein